MKMCLIFSFVSISFACYANLYQISNNKQNSRAYEYATQMKFEKNDWEFLNYISLLPIQYTLKDSIVSVVGEPGAEERYGTIWTFIKSNRTNQVEYIDIPFYIRPESLYLIERVGKKQLAGFAWSTGKTENSENFIAHYSLELVSIDKDEKFSVVSLTNSLAVILKDESVRKIENIRRSVYSIPIDPNITNQVTVQRKKTTFIDSCDFKIPQTIKIELVKKYREKWRLSESEKNIVSCFFISEKEDKKYFAYITSEKEKISESHYKWTLYSFEKGEWNKCEKPRVRVFPSECLVEDESVFARKTDFFLIQRESFPNSIAVAQDIGQGLSSSSYLKHNSCEDRQARKLSQGLIYFDDWNTHTVPVRDLIDYFTNANLQSINRLQCENFE